MSGIRPSRVAMCWKGRSRSYKTDGRHDVEDQSTHKAMNRIANQSMEMQCTMASRKVDAR